MRNFVCVIVAAGMAAGASAQFVNGGFESGDFTGWTIANTAGGKTSFQNIVNFDIDGGGPFGTSKAAQFNVGQAILNSGSQGITLTQALTLTSGTTYTFDFDWAATAGPNQNNAEGGEFSLIVNGSALAFDHAGVTNFATPHYGHLTAIFTPGSTGSYSVGAMIARPFEPAINQDLFQTVDNFAMSPVPEPASLAALGLGALAMVRRRRSR